MNILILNGSPHLDKGATGSVLQTLIKGLNKVNPTITAKYVYKLDINPCQGCFSCWSHTPGKCVQKDDAEEILSLAAGSDIVILATPVYVDGMTGPLKTLLDRFIPLIKGRVELRDNHMRHIVRGEKKKCKTVLVSASGFAEMDNFTPLVDHVKALSRNLGWDYVGELLVPSAWYYQYDTDLLGRALGIVESAGEELALHGRISGDFSREIGSMVSRDKIMKALNSSFSRFE